MWFRNLRRHSGRFCKEPLEGGARETLVVEGIVGIEPSEIVVRSGERVYPCLETDHCKSRAGEVVVLISTPSTLQRR